MSSEYLEQDNILFPDFSNDFDKGIPLLGKFGYMRLEYLKAAKSALFLEYKQREVLVNHLISIEGEATEMLLRLEDKYIELNPLPKDDDFMTRVQAYNQARAYAEEIICNELIYV